MASGIGISSDFDKAIQSLNKRDCSAVVLRINKEMTEIFVERTIKPISGDPEAPWKDFVKSLPESDCRYILTDFQVRDTPTVTKSKIVMISWSPEYSPVRSKMYVI